MKILTAVATSPVGFCAYRVSELLAEGRAVMPLDHRLPAAAARRLIERMKPATIVTPEGETRLEDGERVDDDVSFVVPTSGTTGEPKGVELSYGALAFSAGATYRRMDLSSDDRWLLCLPLAHIAGLSTVFRSQHHGTRPQVMEQFDPAEAIELGEGMVVSLVPTMLRSIMQISSRLPFKAVLLGGGPVPSDLVESARAAGSHVFATYGMTETCGGCVYDGRPLDAVDVRIGDGSSIEISGPILMDRYRLDPSLTGESLRQGWLQTNDVGSFSNGILEVWGRADDVIITGGQKVPPVHVETALMQHPDIRDAAVAGVPDPKWGEAVAALIVGEVTLEEVKSFLSDRLPPYCIPKQLIEVEAIPRGAFDKIDRKAIRALLSP